MFLIKDVVSSNSVSPPFPLCLFFFSKGASAGEALVPISETPHRIHQTTDIQNPAVEQEKKQAGRV